MILEILIGAVLLVASYLDIKERSIPSFFLTSMIFVTILVGVELNNLNFLYFGVVSAIASLLLIEMDFMRGLADLKAIVLAGMIMSSTQSLGIFILSVLFLGVFYKFMWKMKMKDEDIPFMPVILLAYVLTLLLEII